MKLVRRGETRERVVAIFKRDLTLMLLHALLMFHSDVDISMYFS